MQPTNYILFIIVILIIIQVQTLKRELEIEIRKRQQYISHGIKVVADNLSTDNRFASPSSPSAVVPDLVGLGHGVGTSLSGGLSSSCFDLAHILSADSASESKKLDDDYRSSAAKQFQQQQQQRGRSPASSVRRRMSPLRAAAALSSQNGRSVPSHWLPFSILPSKFN